MSDSRTIYLTGVSRGLGQALANLLMENGHVVIGCARNEAVINRMRKVHGSPHRFSVVDVTDQAAVEAWIDESFVDDQSSSLLVNNAALINRNAMLWEVPPEEFEQLMNVNIRGTYHCIRSVVPRMMKAGGGGIINVSSTWGRTTSAEVAPYCASKFAIEGLTSALAQELPPPLFAVAINPGIINTEMLQSCFGSAATGYPSPQEWAQTAMPFLLSLTRRNNGDSLQVPN